MKIFGIAGNARSGKDTFYQLAKHINPNSVRLAFADNLKSDLYDLIKSRMDIDIYSAGGLEKELIRPIMVAYGCAQRERTGGRYWIDVMRQKIDSLPKDSCVFITDVRFTGGEGDECSFIREIGGRIIYLSKIMGDGSESPPANELELKNNKLIKQSADYIVSWPDVMGKNVVDILTPYVLNILHA